MSRLFDPVQMSSLLNEELAENATRTDPLPPGEVVAQIIEQKISSGMSKPKEGKPPAPWYRLDCKVEITDREYLSNYADGTVEKVTRNLGIMLEMTDDAKIATGPNKNVRLGRLRAAADANGKPLTALTGAHIKLMIGHKPHPDDPEITLDEIVSYTKV